MALSASSWLSAGSWNIFTVQLALSMLGLIDDRELTYLKAIGQTLHGPIKEEWRGLPHMTIREHLVIWPLMILMLTLGIWPQWVLVFINDTVTSDIRLRSAGEQSLSCRLLVEKKLSN